MTTPLELEDVTIVDSDGPAVATDAVPAPHRAARPSPVALAGVGLSAVGWLLSIRGVDPRGMTDTGLLSVLPVTAYAALVLLAVSFAVALRDDDRQPSWVAGLHVAALAAIVHGTPPLIEGTLRYSWAFKHVGIVDYIQRYGAVDPTLETLGVYHNWPGFFALNAMLTSTGGFASALSYAAWAPLVVNLLLVAVVVLIARELLDDRRTVLTAAWLFVLANWVGQDYFAPQALAYLWYLVVIFIVLRWLGREASDHTLPTAGNRVNRWLPYGMRYLARGQLTYHDRLIESSYTSPTPREWQDDPELRSPGLRLGLLVFVLLTIWGVVSVHQLTPIALAISLAALAAASRVRIGTLPLLVFVLTVGWLIDVAEPFSRENLRDAFAAVGEVGENVSGTLIGYGQASDGQLLVSLMARSLTVAIALLAVYGFLRSMRRERLGSIVTLALAPATLIAVSGYGSEVLFRTYLFALPFLAIVAAAGLLPPRLGVDLRALCVLVVVSVGLGGALLFGYYGNEDRYSFSPQEIAAAAYVMDRAPDNTLLVEGSRNYPGQFRNYERFTYVPIDREPIATRERIVNRPVQELERWLSNPDYRDAYIIITASQKAETRALGELPHNGLARIERALRRSPRFELVYGNADASVFALADRETAGGDAR